MCASMKLSTTQQKMRSPKSACSAPDSCTTAARCAADKIATYQSNNDPALRIDPYLGIYFYRINVETPQLQDKRVRRALGYDH